MLLVALLLAAGSDPAGYFSHGNTSVDTGSGIVSAKACVACHLGEHAEWAASRHALAFSNGIFRAEFDRRPRDWCVNCHAPLRQQLDAFHAANKTPAQTDLLAEGVGCPACHVRDGVIHARAISGKAPHPVKARDDFGDPTWCGGCHEFNFPRFAVDGSFVESTTHPMQATVSQHAHGPYAKGRCGDCHGSPKNHLYPGAHAEGMRNNALTLSVCRNRGQVVTDLVNSGAGHNVPTGDVHRHVTLRVWRSSSPEKLYDVYIGRRFVPDDAGGNITSEDHTLPPRKHRQDHVAASALGGTHDEPINIELRYVYVVDEFPAAGRRPSEPTFDVISMQRTRLSDLPTCSEQPPSAQ